jgi:hypothetical protein
MWIVARKAYRFNNPSVKLVDALKGTFERGSKAPAEGVAFVEVRPAVNPSAPLLPSNAYGEAVCVPEWVRECLNFQWALNDRDVIIMPDPRPAPVAQAKHDPIEEAGILATLQAADQITLGGESTDIAETPVPPVVVSEAVDQKATRKVRKAS